VGDVEPLEDLRDLIGVGRARAVALLDLVDRLLPRRVDGPGGARQEGVQVPLELRERALRLGALEPRAERGERLARLRGEGVDLLRGLVLAFRSPSST
jgi:hypothetical protein